MKIIISLLLLAGTAAAQSVQYDVLLNQLTYRRGGGGATLTKANTGDCTTGTNDTKYVTPACMQAAINGIFGLVLSRTSNTVASVSAGRFRVNKQVTTISSAITLTNETRLIQSIAYSAPTTTITFTTATSAVLRTGDTLVFSATPTKTPAASCAALLAAPGFTVTNTGSTTYTLTGIDMTTCAGAYTNGDITGGISAQSGTIFVSGDRSTGGVVKFSIPASLGMMYSCAGGACLVIQEATGAYSDVPIGQLTVTTGVITASVEGRGTLSSDGITAGSGITITDAGSGKIIAVDASVCLIDGTNCPTGGGTILGAVSANAGTIPFGTGTANTVTDDTTNFAFNATTKIHTTGNATQYMRTGALINGGILGSGAYGCQWGSVSPTNANWNVCFGAANFYASPFGGAHFWYINGVEQANLTTSAFTANVALISGGTVKGTAYVGSGTIPAVGTCGTIGTGSKNSAGFITSGTTGACTPVITFTVTAPAGWSCGMANSTTLANIIQQSNSSTTTATFSGTTVSGDVLRYNCTAY